MSGCSWTRRRDQGRFRARPGRAGARSRDLDRRERAARACSRVSAATASDRVADVADLVLAEHGRSATEVLQDVRALDVRRGQHARYAGHLLASEASIEHDARVRKGAAHDRQLQRARQCGCRRVKCGGAAGLGHGGWARVGDAHDAPRPHPAADRLGRSLAAQEAAGQLHRLDDLHVAGAAAQVAAQGVLDLASTVGFGFSSSSALVAMIMPGRAEAALDGPGQHERLLDEVRVVGRAQSFDRDDVRAVQVAPPWSGTIARPCRRPSPCRRRTGPCGRRTAWHRSGANHRAAAPTTPFPDRQSPHVRPRSPAAGFSSSLLLAHFKFQPERPFHSTPMKG